MALVLKDRVRETSTTTGSLAFTLAGAVAGFQSFSAIGTGNQTYYTIAGASDWEVGIGTWTSPDQLSRDTILASTNGGAAVNFSSGTKDVFATFPAEGFAIAPPIGGITPNTITGTTITANANVYLPAVVNTGVTTGRLYMVDGGDGYDYLSIDTWDGAGSYQVNFPGGINVVGYTTFTGTVVVDNLIAKSDGVDPAFIEIRNAIGAGVTLSAPTSFSPSYGLTLPTSSGSNNQVLKTDGSGNLSWTDSFIGTNVTLSSNATLAAISDPSAPSNGNVAFYAKTFGGYPTLAARNALNKSFGLQSALWSKQIQMWTPTTATAGLWIGTAGSGNGTYANVNPTVGATLYQSCKRSTYANVITTTNQVLGQNNIQNCFFRGSVAGQGGFFYYARIGFDVWTNGGRFFAGLTANGSIVVSTDPSTVNQTVGFCVDAADNGAISFLTRGSSATKASTGLTIVSNKGYDCYIYCSSNSSQYTWQIIDINTNTSASGTATLNLPTNTSIMAPLAMAGNAALTPATSINFGIVKIYCESDN